ncbi:MAG: radical SAM protein [archaeon]|nr:radical SAM protein [archaeon]
MKKENKLLLIMPRQEVTSKPDYDYLFPLGIAYISSVLKKAAYNVDCLNLNHLKGTIEEILSPALDKKEYNFVCTGHTGLGYLIIEDIIKTVRKHPSKPKTILGGIIITTEPELMFNSLNPDFAVIGEGEITILELLEGIEKNKDLAKIKGIVYRNNFGEIHITEKREPINDLDSIPFPDFDGFEFEKKINNMSCDSDYVLADYPRIYPILGSRGCPFSCTFCYHDNRYRMRSIKSILEELTFAVKKYKINRIVLHDECFAIKLERIEEFCKGITKLRKEISWDLKWIPQLTVHLVDDKLLKMMKDAGCEIISYGFESFSQKVLKSMNKPITPQQIDNAFKKTIAAKMVVIANFIFGDIAETKETSEETLNYWKNSCKGQLGLVVIEPYPGSKIYEHAVKKGIIKDKLFFIKNQMGRIGDTDLNITSMDDQNFDKLKKKIVIYNLKYARTGKNPIWEKHKLKVTCPFCKERINYENLKVSNRLIYDLLFICKNCKMRFHVRSLLKRISYISYPVIRPLYPLYRKAKIYLNRNAMKVGS